LSILYTGSGGPVGGWLELPPLARKVPGFPTTLSVHPAENGHQTLFRAGKAEIDVEDDS